MTLRCAVLCAICVQPSAVVLVQPGILASCCNLVEQRCHLPDELGILLPLADIQNVLYLHDLPGHSNMNSYLGCPAACHSCIMTSHCSMGRHPHWRFAVACCMCLLFAAVDSINPVPAGAQLSSDQQTAAKLLNDNGHLSGSACVRRCIPDALLCLFFANLHHRERPSASCSLYQQQSVRRIDA